MKRTKNKIIISSLVILGIILIFLGSLSKDTLKKSDSYEEYISDLEEKIEDFLKKVDGITEAEVIITLEEYDSNQGISGSLFGDKEQSTTSFPAVRGVAVACTNGNRPEIQVTVTEIVARYLGIPTNRIKIVAKK